MILTKLKDFVGISEHDEYEEEYEEMDWQQSQPQPAPLVEEPVKARRPSRETPPLSTEIPLGN